MSFTSLIFVVFFPVVFILLRLVPSAIKPILLLTASYLFYVSWNARYLLLLVLTTLLDYFIALLISKTSSKRKKKTLIIVSLISNLSVLFLFKYYNFFSENLNELIHAIGFGMHLPVLHVLLPVGISFYTFQSLSYTIDVYRGDLKAERSFARFALYVSYFPQLVAGPIERATNLIPQFQVFSEVKLPSLLSGLRLALWGFFLKLGVADNLARFVDPIYNNPANHSGFFLLLATYFFAFQIYCDFHGYSTIARGISRMLGVELMLNFRTPYLARSVREFWSCWHISLTTWFRDYLYIPLGGNRAKLSRHYSNVMFVFLVSGLWHGANWTFVVWGALNGLYVLAEMWLVNRPSKLKAIINPMPRFIGIFLTFNLICLSWVFFRAGSISDAFNVLDGIIHWRTGVIFDPSLYLVKLGLFLISFVYCVEWAMTKEKMIDSFQGAPVWLRQGCYVYIILLMLIVGRFSNQNQFIYFQF